MNLQKSTRYALCAAMEMATTEPDEAVTALRVAERYGIPGSVLAKVFQQLVRGGIAVGTRGHGGGYRLARDAGEITMLDVMDAIEPRASVAADATGAVVEDADPPPARRLQQVFDEVEELERCTFASISLATLARRSDNLGAISDGR